MPQSCLPSRTRFLCWLCYLVIGTGGVLNMFHPTIRSGFEQVQAEPVDTRLNHYFLEHSYQWIANPEYDFSLWSPPFYAPAPDILALSDNLLGTAPVYWLNRVFASARHSYQLWLMQISLLTFLSTLFFFRSLRVGVILSLLCSYVFAFGLPRIGQIGHPQLLVQVYTPLMLLCFFRFLQEPRTRYLGGLALFFFLQLAAGVYLGWFLALGLMVSGLLYLAVDPAVFLRCWEYLKANLKSVLLIGGGTLLVTGAFMAPYLRMSKTLEGGWGYETVRNFLYPLHAWVIPSHTSFLHRRWAASLYVDNLAEGTHSLGIFGALLLLCAAAGFFFYRGPARKKKLLRVCTLTTAVFLLLLTPLTPAFSLWKLVFELVPGAGAIRAVNRLWVIVYLFWLLAGALALQSWLDRRRKVTCVLLLSGLAGWTILENVQTFIPSFPAAEYEQRVEALVPDLKDRDLVYIIPNPAYNTGAAVLDAMWAGLKANTPVINGASSRPPVGYPENIFQPSVSALRRWVASKDPDWKSFSIVYPPGFQGPKPDLVPETSSRIYTVFPEKDSAP